MSKLNDVKTTFQAEQKEPYPIDSSAEKRSKFIHFRVTPTEFERYDKEYKRSPYKCKSDYFRAIYQQYKVDENIILERKAIIKAAQLSNELNRIGVNFNQLIKAINEGNIIQLSAKDKATIDEVSKYIYHVIRRLAKMDF